MASVTPQQASPVVVRPACQGDAEAEATNAVKRVAQVLSEKQASDSWLEAQLSEEQGGCRGVRLAACQATGAASNRQDQFTLTLGTAYAGPNNVQPKKSSLIMSESAAAQAVRKAFNVITSSNGSTPKQVQEDEQLKTNFRLDGLILDKASPFCFLFAMSRTLG